MKSKFVKTAFAAASALFLFSGCANLGDKDLAVKYTLTVEQYPASGGTVDPAYQSDITADTPVNIAADAAPGYRFVNWTLASGHAIFDDADDANTTVRLGWNATIRANFEQIVPVCGNDGHGYFNNDIEYGSLIDDRDGRCYRTVEIDGQTWMAENLNWTGADGSLGRCYDDDPDNCAVYGRLYTWLTVMDGAPATTSNPSGVQGICPAGWHVPSLAEWLVLTNFVNTNPRGVQNNAGARLKAESGWDDDGGGTDDFGFSALPGGYSFGNTNRSLSLGERGNWWSATEEVRSDGNWVQGRYINNDGDFMAGIGSPREYNFGRSLRCVAD